MAITFLRNDAFEDTFSTAALGRRTDPPGIRAVRRPRRGLVVRDDVYGAIRVATAGNPDVILFDSSSDVPYPGASLLTTNFVISRISEVRVEKSQMMETFGSWYVFFFGERPRVINVQAVLLDTPDFNWVAEWWANYDIYLRGTRCVETKARMELTWKDTYVAGYLLQASTDHVAEQPHMAMLTFSMVVSNYINITAPRMEGALAFFQDVNHFDTFEIISGSYAARGGVNVLDRQRVPISTAWEDVEKQRGTMLTNTSTASAAAGAGAQIVLDGLGGYTIVGGTTPSGDD